MNPSTPSFERLADECLLCQPDRHGQAEQILLRSDTFYFFAGLGPIVDGYVMIVPYRCDDLSAPARSLAELSAERFDELLFLRALLADFYQAEFGNPGLSFEHGRAGSCLAGQGDSRHCHHAHLCCYPVHCQLEQDLESFRPINVAGLPDLPTLAKASPYLYTECVCWSDDLPLDRQASLVLLPHEKPIESQLLRKVLAKRLGRAELWDWRKHPGLPSVRSLLPQFREWLRRSSRYEVDWSGSVPRLDFLGSVTRANADGNDRVARDYFDRYRRRLTCGSVGKFLGTFRDNAQEPQTVLDVGCGPGLYARAFSEMGLRVTAIDDSDAMLEIARREAGNEVEWVKMDATRLHFPERSFDAVWCSAFLVHVPRAQAADMFARLWRVMKEDGILYLSAQIGKGCRVQKDGRVFFYYAREELEDLCRAAGFSVFDAWGGTTDVNSGGGKRLKTWRSYLLKKTASRATPLPEGEGRSGATLLDLGEHKLLARIVKQASRPLSENVVVGIGDDCAAVDIGGGRVLVATIDPCPQPVVCMLGDNDLWYSGWLSVVINVSDLAAMGAEPLGILVSVEAPQDMSVSDFDRFYAGVLAAAEAHGCPVLGGNLKDIKYFNCVGSAFGIVPRERMLLRDSAKPNERVVVLGEMGLFWAGVLHWLKGIRLPEQASERLHQRLRRPCARIAEGRRLAELGLSHCAMDSSDGLTACFYEIARKGQSVDVHIDLSAVVPDPAVKLVADELGLDVRKLLLAWGDWELVCTVNDKDIAKLRDEMAKLACPVSVVGWVSSGSGDVWLHEPGQTARLADLSNVRFARESYFSNGLEACVTRIMNQPLTV